MRNPHLIILALVVGCGAGPSPAAPRRHVLPAGWEWQAEPASTCNDGSPTGFGLSAGTSNDLLIFFLGGGACWDYETCIAHPTALLGPFGEDALASTLAGAVPNGVLDRIPIQNPFRRHNIAVIPYCTGDAQAGKIDSTYGGRLFRHQGRHNLQLYVDRLAAQYPAPRTLTVAGVSGGALSATLAYDFLRAHWPSAQGYLISDSWPLTAAAAALARQRMWIANWHADLGDCGGCADGDLAAIWPHLSSKYSGDAFLYLSHLPDQIIAPFYGQTESAFTVAVLQAEMRVATLPRLQRYLIAQPGHTFLGGPSPELWGVLQRLVSQYSTEPH